jgi:hypothetical protein
MSLISAGSISLDSTFKSLGSVTNIELVTLFFRSSLDLVYFVLICRNDPIILPWGAADEAVLNKVHMYI